MTTWALITGIADDGIFHKEKVMTDDKNHNEFKSIVKSIADEYYQLGFKHINITHSDGNIIPYEDLYNPKDHEFVVNKCSHCPLKEGEQGYYYCTHPVVLKITKEDHSKRKINFYENFDEHLDICPLKITPFTIKFESKS